MPPYQPILVKPDPTGLSATLDWNYIFDEISNEFAYAVILSIRFSELNSAILTIRKLARKCALEHLRGITRVTADYTGKEHDIFNNLEVLAFLKKHKRQWRKVMEGE